MKCLITFSLYGNSPKYVLGLYENLELAPQIYPGWDVRVYIDRYHYCIPTIKRKYPYVQVVEKPETPGSSGMFWRFEPVGDTAYSHIIVRDADSRLSQREVPLVQQWISSGKALHAIRDNPWHNNRKVIGGACGFMPAQYPNWNTWQKSWSHSNRYGDDEKFLEDIVWNNTSSDNRMIHSSQGSVDGGEVFFDRPEGVHICQPVIPDWKKHLTKLYVVNAPHYKNRMLKFQEAIKRSEYLSGLEIVRFEGCTKAAQKIPYWWRGDREHWWLASQDHKRLMHDCLIRGEDLILIFEDDGHPASDFDLYFQRAWDTVPANWWALMLGGQSCVEREYVSNDLRDHLALVNGVRGQHSVLWTWEGLKYFWDHCMYWNWQTIDEAFEGFQKECRRVYSPAKWIVNIVGVQFGRDN